MAVQTRLQLDIRNLPDETIPALKRLAFERDLHLVAFCKEVLIEIAAAFNRRQA